VLTTTPRGGNRPRIGTSIVSAEYVEVVCAL
jgi:hypothetical protein